MHTTFSGNLHHSALGSSCRRLGGSLSLPPSQECSTPETPRNTKRINLKLKNEQSAANMFQFIITNDLINPRWTTEFICKINVDSLLYFCASRLLVQVKGGNLTLPIRTCDVTAAVPSIDNNSWLLHPPTSLFARRYFTPLSSFILTFHLYYFVNRY